MVPETAATCPVGRKLWRAKPQERIRPERGPASSGRSKASGGCENLEAQGGRAWTTRPRGRCPEREDAEGEKTSREAPPRLGFAATWCGARARGWSLKEGVSSGEDTRTLCTELRALGS